MKTLISFTTAGRTLLALQLGFLLLHFAALTGIVPSDLVWAGRLTDRDELVQMESLSLLILATTIGIVLARLGYIGRWRHSPVVRVAMWVVLGIFLLNTLANLTAASPIERYGFGLATFIMTLLALRVAAERR